LSRLRSIFARAAKQPSSILTLAAQTIYEEHGPQHAGKPAGGANDDAAEPAQPPEQPAAQPEGCAGKSKAGKPCRAALVAGHPLCAAHLYGERGKGICRRATTGGALCPQANAKGMQGGASHQGPRSESMWSRLLPHRARSRLPGTRQPPPRYSSQPTSS
jgi:hypothetical protein